jgi:hypothetical protein
MRDYVILTVAVFGALWAFDAYRYDGRYSQAVWEQASEEGRNFSNSIHRAVDMAMAGECGFCD